MDTSSALRNSVLFIEINTHDKYLREIIYLRVIPFTGPAAKVSKKNAILELKSFLRDGILKQQLDTVYCGKDNATAASAAVRNKAAASAPINSKNHCLLWQKSLGRWRWIVWMVTQGMVLMETMIERIIQVSPPLESRHHSFNATPHQQQMFPLPNTMAKARVDRIR